MSSYVQISGAAGGGWGRRKEAETLGWFRRQRRPKQPKPDSGGRIGQGAAVDRRCRTGPRGWSTRDGPGVPRIGRCLFPTPASPEKLRQRKYQMMKPNAHSVRETEATSRAWQPGLEVSHPFVQSCVPGRRAQTKTPDDAQARTPRSGRDRSAGQSI